MTASRHICRQADAVLDYVVEDYYEGDELGHEVETVLIRDGDTVHNFQVQVDGELTWESSHRAQSDQYSWEECVIDTLGDEIYRLSV